LLLGYAFCLRAFLSLDNFELDIIAFLEALIALRLDGTVVDEHIGPIIPANKAEALCVIEPFHFSFYSRHVPYSRRSLAAIKTCSADRFSFSWFCHLLLGETMASETCRRPMSHPYTRYFGFGFILRFVSAGCQLI
jgi:hypothetical protein